MDRKPKSKRSFWSINKKLIPLKILIFILYGGMAALYPYLSIHMRYIGLTITETTIVYALLPVLCFMGPALAGAAADKMGNYKIILVVSILVNIGLHTLIYFGVPAYVNKYVPEPYNSSLVQVTMPCTTDGRSIFSNRFAFLLENLPNATNCSQPNLSNTNISAVSLNIEYGSCSTDCVRLTYGFNDVCWSREENYNGTCYEIHKVVEQLWISDLNLTSDNSTTFSGPNLTGTAVLTATAACQIPDRSTCAVTCALENPFSMTCSRHVIEGNRQLTFWLYFIFRVLASIALAAVFPLMDAAIIQMSEEHHGNIGMQRMYSLLGVCTLAPIAGLLMDQLDMGYAPAFFLYDIMHLFAAIAAGVMSISIKIPAENIWKNVGGLLKNARIVVFIIVVFFIGAAWGLLDSFFFWFMEEDLKSPKWFLGFTNTVGGLFGVPLMATATKIIKRFGHTNILIFSMFIYGARYIGYSYVYTYYEVLPLEALEAFTNSLMWITATIYASKIAPAYLATLQGIVGGMHYGIGRGAGALIGGLMIRAVGARVAWRIFGLVCFGCGILYALLQYFWLRKLSMPGKPSKNASKEPPLQFPHALSLHEIHAMSEEDEEKLDEIAILNVLKATSAGAVTGSTVSIQRDVDQVDDPATVRLRKHPENSAHESDEDDLEDAK